MSLEAVELWSLAVLFVASLVRATFGFGEALIAMPLLTILLGLEVAAPLLALSSLTLGTIILVRDWRHLEWRGVWRLTLASLIGIPIGMALVDHVDRRVTLTVLAVVVIGFAGSHLLDLRPVRLRSERAAWPFGFFAGILGGAYNTSGPLMVMYGTLREWPRHQFRVMLQGCFMANGLLIALLHGWRGRYTPRVLLLFTASLLVVLATAPLGGWLSRRLHPESFVRLVYGLLLIVGCSLLVHAWRG